MSSAQIVAELLKNGVLGLAVLALGLVVKVLWSDNRALVKERQDVIERLQAQRVADAQAVTAQLLKTNEQCVTALTNVTNAMEAQVDAMGELKGAFKELSEDIRQRRPGR